MASCFSVQFFFTKTAGGPIRTFITLTIIFTIVENRVTCFFRCGSIFLKKKIRFKVFLVQFYILEILKTSEKTCIRVFPRDRAS